MWLVATVSDYADIEHLSHSRKFYQTALIQKNELIWCQEALASLFPDSQIMAAFKVQEKTGFVSTGDSVGAVHLLGKQVP